MKILNRAFTFLLLLAITGKMSAQIPLNGLVAFYPFSGNALDESGNGNHGTVFGAKLTPDRCEAPDSAFKFNGTDQYILINDAPNLNSPAGISLCAWIKPTSFRGNGNSAMISKGYYSHVNPYYQYHLGITGDQYPNTPACFHFSVSINGDYLVITGDSIWKPDHWYFVTGTYDGNELRLYVNAQLVKSYFAPGEIDTYSQPVSIAHTRNFPDSHFTPGTMDDIMIYNRALSFEEVEGLFSSRCLIDKITGPEMVCQNQQSVEYLVNSVLNAETYEWTYSGQGVTLIENDNQVSLDFASSATSGRLTVKVNGVNLSSQQSSVDIAVKPTPAAAGTISGPKGFCAGQNELHYEIPSIPGATSYIWTYSGESYALNQSNNILIIYPLFPSSGGDLQVTGINQCGTGLPSDVLHITEIKLPDKTSTIEGTHSVCQNQGMVPFSITASSEISSYEWNYSGTGITIVGNTENVELWVLNDATSGNLTVHGINECGIGPESDVFPIIARVCNSNADSIYIPNSFSPNEDGMNDYFEIIGLPSGTSLSIFNRAGKLLYNTDDYSNNWTGVDDDGKTLETGIYWYVVTMNKLQATYKGYVFLKR